MDFRSYLSRREIILTNLYYGALTYSDDAQKQPIMARDAFLARLDLTNQRLKALQKEAEEDSSDFLKMILPVFRNSSAG